MAKPKRKLTPKQKIEKELRRQKYMYVFMNGRQVRVLEERPATSLSPGCLQFVAPPAIPEPGSAASALEPLLDPPPTQGCASSKHGIPGGCPAGKAVWPRLIITPGKLRAAL